MSFDMIFGIVSTVLFFAALIFVGFKFKEEDEKYYPLFIFFYYFFASFKLNISAISIPLGFAICLIFIASRPQAPNKRAKKAAVVLGLAVFLLGCIVPAAREQILTYQRTLSVEKWNVRDFNFSREYAEVLNTLGFREPGEANPTVSAFDIQVDKNDNIQNLNFTLTLSDNTYQAVSVTSGAPIGHTLTIKPILKTEGDMQQLISTMKTPNANARHFFQTLDKVTLEKMEYTDTDGNVFSLWRSLANGDNQSAEVYEIKGDSFQQVANQGQSGNILVCGGLVDSGDSNSTAKFKYFLIGY